MATRHKTNPERALLTRTVQLRFTETQYVLLQRVAVACDRSVGAIVRDVVTVWAANHEAAGAVDVSALVAELEAVAEVDG